MLVKRERTDGAELDIAVSELDPDSALKGGSNSKERNPNSTTVVEDDDKQPRIITNYKPIYVGNSLSMSTGQCKRHWKATEIIGAPPKLGKKRHVAKIVIQPESQKSGPLGSGASHNPSTEAP